MNLPPYKFKDENDKNKFHIFFLHSSGLSRIHRIIHKIELSWTMLRFFLIEIWFWIIKQHKHTAKRTENWKKKKEFFIFYTRKYIIHGIKLLRAVKKVLISVVIHVNSRNRKFSFSMCPCSSCKKTDEHLSEVTEGFLGKQFWKDNFCFAN